MRTSTGAKGVPSAGFSVNSPRNVVRTENAPFTEMITIRRKSTSIWFCPATEKMNPFGLSHYFNAQSTGKKLGFVRKIVHTPLIDLSMEPTELLKSFEKNTQYEIRRAQREGVEFSTDITLQEFIDFYNVFAETKGRRKLTVNLLEAFAEKIQLTRAVAKGTCLAVHFYLCDPEASRARLQYSATHFRKETDKEIIKLTGYANRFLHFSDMCHFKSLGYRTYDLGGYAHQTTNQELAQINRFKDCFQGRLVEEGDYISIPLYLIEKIKTVPHLLKKT